ncbi:MAG: radical SAM protein [Deltaproteobacteria bacterium]|nr:radical SAM protein [Deltaproteobacteria bacterium]
MAVPLEQQNRDLTLDEVVEKYPQVPRLIALKIDVQRRGVHYTASAESVVDGSIHQLRSPYIFGSRDGQIKPLPESLILRDGTSILTDPTPPDQNPYFVDLVDGRLTLVDEGEPVEFVELWPKPRYYDKSTSSGIPMSHIVSARPQRLNIFQSSFCHFWADKKECRFCDIVNHTKQQKDALGVPTRLRPADVSETIREALSEPGRFTGMCLTAGSVIKGKELFDHEVEYYIETLQAVGENFSVKKFPSQLIASAFNEKQLARLYEETGLMSYTSDLEVLGEKLFNWICPGKAESVGYREWRQRLIRAVDIFGRGNVGTGLVGGVELAAPHGFTSEDDALESTLSEAEYLAEHGVTTVYIVWVPRPGSGFRDQRNPSLEYYVRLSKGLHDLRVKYGLGVDFDDYRRCGNHPDTDLSRLL